LWKLWAKRGRTTGAGYYRQSFNPDRDEKVNSNGNACAPNEWENVLGGLVVGQPTKNTHLANKLNADPGVSIYQKLIRSFRGSMVVGALPLTSRLLMGILGEQFSKLLSDYWTLFTPELFASDEALGFARYLRKSDLKIAYLNDVLEFEEAVIYSRVTGNTLALRYSYDIITILTALHNRQLPPTVPLGQDSFNLLITDGEITYTKICEEAERPGAPVFIPDDKRQLIRNWNH